MGQGEGGRAEGDWEGGWEDEGGSCGPLVAVEKTSAVSQLPVCGRREMLTSAFFHVRSGSSSRKNTETSLIHVLTVVKGTLHPSQCAGETKQKGKVTEKDPKEQQTQIFSFREDQSLCVAVSFHSAGFLHHYLIPGFRRFGHGGARLMQIIRLLRDKNRTRV